MKPLIPALAALALTLSSCIPATQPPSEEKTSTWKNHPHEPVPHVFGETTEKEYIRSGFYEQSGSVPSSASWESIAHYTFIAHNGHMIGYAGRPYSISPSGRYLIIPVSYLHGEKQHTLKIYDKKLNRYTLQYIPAMTISSYQWTPNEQSVEITSQETNKTTTIHLPTK